MTKETVFHEAVCKPPAARAAFLDAACAGRPELRAEVEAMIAARDAVGRIPNPPASIPPRPDQAETGLYVPAEVRLKKKPGEVDNRPK